MREQYVRQVQKELSVPRKLKKEILRDLNEAFDSAAEHGETEEQVTRRLGTPKDFAENIEENSGFRRQHRKGFAGICCFCGIALVCFFAAWITRAPALPENVIGQADAATTILVKSALPFDLSSVFLAIGLIAAAAAVVRIIGFARGKKRRSRGKTG